MKNSLRHLLILLLALPLPLPASASCALCTCTVSATGVSFGRYNPLSDSNLDDTGNVRISCGGGTGTVSYTIRLNRGISAGFSGRMSSGNNRISYELYTDPAHTILWGDGSGGTGVISGTLDVSQTGSSREHVVYGRMPASQRLAAVGSYSDTLTYTIVYQ